MDTTDKSHNRFTKVVWTILVLICLAATATIAIPNFLKSRDREVANVCVRNLRQIDEAKEQWAMEKKAQPTDAPTWADLVGPGKSIKAMPICPGDGKYSINTVATAPTCSYTNQNPKLMHMHVLICQKKIVENSLLAFAAETGLQALASRARFR
jgi:hypothetical protein